MGALHWLMLYTSLLLIPVTLCEDTCPSVCTCSDDFSTVDCSSINLTSIPENIPSNVTHLNLANNSISVLGDQPFVRFTDLIRLDLSNNVIETLLDDTFNGLGNLQFLYLSSNKIQTMNYPFNTLTSLGSIELNNNLIEAVQPKLFSKCYPLRNINLADNKLNIYALDALNIISEVTHLDLSGNSFGILPYLLFNNLGKLESLKFRNCQINAIDANSFVKIGETLVVLDLTDNKIKYLRREMFQPLGDQFSGLSLADNRVLCDCGTARFQDWLKQRGVALDDEATCVSNNGTTYIIETADFSGFCDKKPANMTPNREGCSENSSLSLALSEIDSSSADIQYTTVDLPPTTQVYLQLKLTENNRLIQKKVISPNDSVQEFHSLTADTAYTLCAFNLDCSVWSCLTLRTTTSKPPTDSPVTECTDVGLAIGLTIGGCILLIIIILVVVVLLYNAALLTCVCLKQDRPPAGYHYDRRRSTKYGATIYSDYQAADDNNYEAIPVRNGSQLSRKYEIPDDEVTGNGDFPGALPPKKKPLHFVRDPNFSPQGTAAHGEIGLEVREARDSSGSGNGSPNSEGSSHDRKGIPLPAIPESSVRRKELAEPYLEPTPSTEMAAGWDEQPQPPVATIAHSTLPSTWVQPATSYTNQRPNTYLEADPDFDATVPNNRTTADFTRGISFKFDDKSDNETRHSCPNSIEGSISSGVLLLPNLSSPSTEKPFIPIKMKKRKKSKRSERLGNPNSGFVSSDITNRTPLSPTNLGKKRPSIQFTDDIYLDLEKDKNNDSTV